MGLNDGNYFLHTTAALITNNGVALDGAKNGTPGSNETDEFWRLYGDTLGRRQVDWTDNKMLVDSYNSTSVDFNYPWFLDYNMDGTIG